MATKKTNETAEVKTVVEETAAEVTKATVTEAAADTGAEQKKETAENPSNSGGFCMYIGPSIPGVIQSGTVYEGTKDKAVAMLYGVIKDYPLVEKLIVSDKTLPEDRLKVKTPGNYLYNMYRSVSKKEER